MRYEKNTDLYFSPIESEFATRFFQEKGCAQPDLSTFYLYREFQLYTQSTGALKLIQNLKWYFKILYLFQIIPICQRDQLYRFVARNRQKISGFYCVNYSDQKHRFLS
jgi:predicted DCC family thiol-disulfide oxidoreductase YuxK